jgi:hypothetical protein
MTRRRRVLCDLLIVAVAAAIYYAEFILATPRGR